HRKGGLAGRARTTRPNRSESGKAADSCGLRREAAKRRSVGMARTAVKNNSPRRAPLRPSPGKGEPMGFAFPFLAIDPSAAAPKGDLRSGKKRGSYRPL